MRRSRVCFGFSSLLLVAGCAQLGLDFGQDSQSVNGGGDPLAHGEGIHGAGWGSVNTGPIPEFCTKIEGDEIGQAGLQLSFGGLSLTIESWLSKDGEQGEYIGFTYAASAGVWFSVKCANDIFQENGDGSWVNPNGTAGPDASAISNIVFCPPAGDDGSPQPGGVPGGSGPGDGEPGAGDVYCSEVHPELCPGGVYPGDEGSGDGANPGGVPGAGSVPGSGDGDDGSDDGASPGGDPGSGSVPGAGDDGSGTYYCSEEHPELCPGGVFPGGDSSGGDDGSAGSTDPGSSGSVDGSGSSGSTGTGDSGGSTGTGDGSGSTGDSGGSTGSGDGSSGGSGTTTQCTEQNLADCL